MVLEKTLESPLDCKAIQPVHSKGDQSWVLFGRTDAKAETPVLGCNLKNGRMISVCFQGKPFNIMVIQAYAPTSNAEEAEVEWFYEDLQDLLELTPKQVSPWVWKIP